MMNGAMTSAEYALGLSQLYLIHEAVEQAASQSASVAAFFAPSMIRTKTIERDLEAFGYTKSSFQPLSETIAIVNQIHEWSANSPHAILGCIYVLEGSRMGSLVIAKPLGRTLGILPGNVSGLEYHLEGAAETPARLRHFKEKVDQAGLDSQSENDVVNGAVQFMEMLNLLYAALPVRRISEAEKIVSPPAPSTGHPVAIHRNLRTA
jgi:heme oxygenase